MSVAMAAGKTVLRFGLMIGRVRIAHLKWHLLNGFICTKSLIFFYSVSIGFISLAWLRCAMRTRCIFSGVNDFWVNALFVSVR